MGKISGRYILPHPPILIPSIGKGEEKKAKKTLDGIKKVGEEIAKLKPGRIIVISPHGAYFSDHFHIPDQNRISGDLSQFGRKNLILGFNNDPEFVHAVETEAKNRNISAGPVHASALRRYGLKEDLDHGVIVPLYFVSQFYQDYRLVPISLAGLSKADHYELGKILRSLIDQDDTETVIIASGDLSHKLSDEGPYGFAPEGPVFDRAIADSLLSGDPLAVLQIDEALKERAGQCGEKSIIMLLGTVDKHKIKAEIFSYEGPYGVGYMTARIEEDSEKNEDVLSRYEQWRKEKAARQRTQSTLQVNLARDSLATYIHTGKEMSVPSGLPYELTMKQAGAFVSIKKSGQLRGCIGTIAPTQRNIAEEIITSAISAGTKDPRFPAITADELEDLTISVDILGPEEEIRGEDDLNPNLYGVIVRSGRKQGLLLPNLDGIDTVAEQLRIAKEKAGIKAWEKIRLFRFKVERYT